MSNEDEDIPFSFKQKESKEDPFAPIQELLHKYSGILNVRILPRIAIFIEKTDGEKTKLSVLSIFSKLLNAHFTDLIKIIWKVTNETKKSDAYVDLEDNDSSLVDYYKSKEFQNEMNDFQANNTEIFKKLPVFSDVILYRSFYGFEEKDGTFYNGLYQEFQAYFDQNEGLYNRETLFLFRGYIETLKEASHLFLIGLREEIENHLKESSKTYNSPGPTFRGFELLSPSSLRKGTKSRRTSSENLGSVAKRLTFSEVNHKRQGSMMKWLKKGPPNESKKRSRVGGSRRLLRSKRRKTRRSRMN